MNRFLFGGIVRDAENISDTKNDGVVLDWHMDRRKHLSVFGLLKETGFYAMRSAPWYLELIVHGVFTLILIVVLLLIMYAMKQKMKKEQCDVKHHAVNTDQKQ